MNRKYISLENFFLLFFSTSYVFGFLLRENIAGGAEDDFLNFTWPVIISENTMTLNVEITAIEA